ncbi:MAG: hypothetical protein ACI9VM_000565, partial [Candidatus Azotimanducaceae bacterium]
SQWQKLNQHPKRTNNIPAGKIVVLANNLNPRVCTDILIEMTVPV